MRINANPPNQRLQTVYGCCKVRTGALYLSVLCEMGSILAVITLGLILANYDLNVKEDKPLSGIMDVISSSVDDRTYSAGQEYRKIIRGGNGMESQWDQGRQSDVVDQIEDGFQQIGKEVFKESIKNPNVSGGLAKLLEANKNQIRRFLEFLLAFALGELALNSLLIYGLAQRKHFPCMPWLIYNGSFLTVFTTLPFILTWWLWSNGAPLIGTCILCFGVAIICECFYNYWVVLSEWMNIKYRHASVRQVAIGNQSTNCDTAQLVPQEGRVVIESLPAYPRQAGNYALPRVPHSQACYDVPPAYYTVKY